MRFQSTGMLLAGALAATLVPSVAGQKTCLMIYQMADNNLEFYLRQDYQELSRSQVVKSPDLRTWIYYDALNQGGQALPNTAGVSGAFTGSRYVTFDQSIGQMRVDKTLSGEQNSDTQGAVSNFLDHALDDCMGGGFTSLMAVFSSHGGGFAGYGGDENGRRQLLQTNTAVASAVRSSLDKAGADQLEVIGFDACLMQAVGAIDDYKGVAKYMLASEAVEPGHGWAYAYLTNANSALELAQQIHNTFLTQTQGGSSHQSPKTMSIVDTAKFSIFLQAIESFSANLLTELQGGDQSLYSFVSRARSSAVAFEGIIDAIGSQNPSAMDIGSWLTKFQSLCVPGEPLQTDLANAIAAYRAMFVARGTGPGTSPGTGMHVTWPNQGEYRANTALWNQVLFNNPSYATQIAPKFKAFLQWYLSSSAPGGGGGSICGQGAIPPAADVSNANPGALIITESGRENQGQGTFDVRATISADVSQMLVEYGIDLSTALKPVLEEKGYTPKDDEFLYLLGGDVAGTYQGSTYSASWDKDFYFLNITGTNTFEALYVFDQGDGSRKIPAMYFPEEKREEVGNLQFLDYLFFDFDYWTTNGARFSFLKFSENETVGRINDNLALFISNEDNVFSEQPRSKGGLMIPLVYIDAYIQGRHLNTLPGGFNQTVITWGENIGYNILRTPAERIFEVIPSTDAIIINMYAFNHGDPDAEPDAKYYDVSRQRGQLGGLQLEGEATDGAVSDNGSLASGGVSMSLGFVSGLGLFLVGMI